MTNKIKRFMLIVAFTVIPAGMIITPNPSFAFDGGFGKTNYVKDIGVAKANEEKKNDDLMKTIQKAINWALGILAAIALCLVIYAGFLMLTSGGDSKKYDQGISIIKNAAIGLAIIGVSWLIVSLIFYIIEGSTGSSE